MKSYLMLINKGYLVGSTFNDLSHSQLIAKLPMYSVHDRELCWFIYRLFHHQAVAQYDSSVSDKMDVLSSVPQGLILGPMLFLLIFCYISSCSRSLYIHIIKTKLTDNWKNLSEWLTTNKLIIIF